MAIDFKTLDKKKLVLGIVAVATAFAAVILTNIYINSTVGQKTEKFATIFREKEAARLAEQFRMLEQNDHDLAHQLRNLDNRLKQIDSGAGKPVMASAESLAAVTPQGMRAVTVMVDRLAAVGGLVMPGDRVDIVSHVYVPTDPYNPSKKDLMSFTLFQNALVLAVDGVISGKPKTSGNQMVITFAMDPQEAGLLTFASKNGKLQLFMRSSVDSRAYILPPSDWEAFSNYVNNAQGLDIGYQDPDEVDFEEDVSDKRPRPKPSTIELYEDSIFQGLR